MVSPDLQRLDALIGMLADELVCELIAETESAENLGTSPVPRAESVRDNKHSSAAPTVETSSGEAA
jgi:hypothetical protein